MNNEQWIDISGQERYQISSRGRVINKSTGLIRKPSVSKNGYLLMVFSNPGGKFSGKYIHRMVALAFIGSPGDGFEVSHIDGNKKNNCLQNLLYETHKENLQRRNVHGTINSGMRNGSAKLSELDVMEITRLRKSGFKLLEIGNKFGVSFQQVSRICNGENWRDLTKGADSLLARVAQ